MKKKNKILIVIFSLVFLSIISLAIINQNLISQSSSQQELIDFELPVIDKNGLQKRTFKLSEYKGYVILLEFAVEWCPHCENMVPVLKQIYNNFNQKGVMLVTVMLNSQTTLERTVEFIKKHDIPWLNLFDANLNVAMKYEIKYTPTFVIVDRNF
jgi:Peroxiredoxin